MLPMVDLVWAFADLVTNTSLVLALGFSTGATQYAWLLSLNFTAVLIFRYFYLAFTWIGASTEKYFGTSRFCNIAVYLWAIPVGVLGAAVAYWGARHWFGLRLPPRGLANGPEEWTDDRAVIQLQTITVLSVVPHALIYYGILKLSELTNRTLKLKSDNVEDDQCPEYSVAKASRPADFFNTNTQLALMVQSVCHGDPEGLISRLPKIIRERGLAKLQKTQKARANETDPVDAKRLAYECQALGAFGGAGPVELGEPPPDAHTSQNAAEILMPFIAGKEYQQGPPFDKYLHADHPAKSTQKTLQSAVKKLKVSNILASHMLATSLSAVPSKTGSVAPSS